ncbi:MAG: 2-dehydropantoate 2-reductase [Bacteroides sp.]
MKYLIIGVGGVGGSIASFLALAGKEVSCIARGAHLKAIQEKGIHLLSGLKGEHYVPVKSCTGEEYKDKADVIFVCVKGYSIDSIKDIILRAAHKDTLVIPILNVYGTGPRIQQLVPEVMVLDGCIYIVGFVSAPGEITQMGTIFRMVFGARKEQDVPREKLEAIQADLVEAGIKAPISDDINRDTFVKWSFISAMACTGAYYDASMGMLQKQGKERDTFIGLSRESAEIGKSLGITFNEDVVAYNLKVLDTLAPANTASLQKDLAKHHESEINGLLFNVIKQAEELGIEVPTYQAIATKFK